MMSFLMINAHLSAWSFKQPPNSAFLSLKNMAHTITKSQ